MFENFPGPVTIILTSPESAAAQKARDDASGYTARMEKKIAAVAKAAKTYKASPKKVCSKCKGTGLLPGYAMIANGTCFPCQGTGKVIDHAKTK